MLGLRSKIKLILWTGKPVNRKIRAPKYFFFVLALLSRTCAVIQAVHLSSHSSAQARFRTCRTVVKNENAE